MRFFFTLHSAILCIKSFSELMQGLKVVDENDHKLATSKVMPNIESFG